jgi:methyl-accepting chemotaxis protein
MGKATNDYSESLILEILETFQSITHLSQGISTEVMISIRRLMTMDNSESLGTISRESAAIGTTMDRFLDELSSTVEFSRRSMIDNIAQMQRVKVMAETIADFSESIRMISLNLNIEAARSGQSGTVGGGRGIQVLAINLSEFAKKAQELAGQQREIIDTASKVVETSGSSQMDQLNGLSTKIPAIKARLAPFTGIVKATYDQFQGVAERMEVLSVAIDEQLKGVIGKFQFQDLVRQQNDHILSVFGHIRDLALSGRCEDECVDEAHRNEALEELIDFFESIATTENELVAIAELRRLYPGLKKAQSAETDLTAGSVQLF